MPVSDKSLSQPVNELLREIIDNLGFFDRKKLIFNKVRDVNFVAACQPPGGGRQRLTPRLIRHFHMCWLPFVSDVSMKRICSSILAGFLPRECQATVDSLVSASVEIYQRITENMKPTPSRSHYTFNLRDLGKLLQGILSVERDDLSTFS